MATTPSLHGSTNKRKRGGEFECSSCDHGADGAVLSQYMTLGCPPDIKKDIPIGLRGKPFVLRGDQVEKAIGASFGGFFTFNDLEKAMNDDFLDAGRGTTDN